MGTSAQTAPQQSEAELADTTDFKSAPEATTAAGKLTWPKQMPEQVVVVCQALGQGSLPAEAIARNQSLTEKIDVQAVLGALEELGIVSQETDQFRLTT